MRIHKRVIDVTAPSEVVEQITSIAIEPGLDIEVTIADEWMNDLFWLITFLFYFIFNNNLMCYELCEILKNCSYFMIFLSNFSIENYLKLV